MKLVALGVLLASAYCNAAGIGIATAGGSAAGGYKFKGGFIGPFWVADITLFKKLGGVAPLPLPCGPCNGADAINTGMCVPAGTCGQANTATARQSVAGDCSEYGVGASKNMECCVNTNTCGAAMSNGSFVSYFQNPSYPSSDKGALSCNFVIKVNAGVTQLRLDFIDFELPAPDVKDGCCDSKNSMTVVAPRMPLGILGQRRGNGDFCGMNSGQHVYIPVGEGEQVQIVTTLTGYGSIPLHRASVAYDQNSAYRWNIRITQIMGAPGMCFSDLAAPGNCLQHYTEPFDKLSSFNFDGFSAISPNLDYTICIDPAINLANGLTIRSTVFKMPVGGKDILCEEGIECINRKTGLECCLDPHSGYIGYTAGMPLPHGKLGEEVKKHYWCGKNLGPDNQMTGDFYHIKVKTGEGWDCPYNPIGFNLEYKAETGF